MGGSWSKFYLMLGSVEKDYLLVIYILAISTLAECLLFIRNTC